MSPSTWMSCRLPQASARRGAQGSDGTNVSLDGRRSGTRRPDQHDRDQLDASESVSRAAVQLHAVAEARETCAFLAQVIESIVPR
jgi:hypothetical protein